MRILVTGASGFVGGAFLRRHAGRADLQLTGTGRRATDLPDYLRCDLSQPFDLPVRADVVIHAAARSSPWGTRAEYSAQNIDATRHVIDFCRRNGHPRLVYLSSSSVFYREAHQYDLREDSPVGPTFVNTYAQTKYAGEQLVREYPGEHVIVRPRAVFGVGDTVLFPRILDAARRGALPLFTGQDRPVVGDLIQIDTLSDYLLRVATMDRPADSYNLTNAQPVDIQALLLDVLARLDLQPPARRVRIGAALRMATVAEWLWRGLRLRGEPPLTRFGVGVFAYSKTFDPARMLADLGPPSVSIATGIDDFIAWQRAQWAA